MTTARDAVDLVVLGPPKTGSSTLFATLQAHPGVETAHAKEPMFFSTDGGFDGGVADGPDRSGAYDRGIDWYLALFDGSKEHNRRVRLEGSTGYFASASSPELLVRHAPGVHVVVILREPSDRIASHHAHERRVADLPMLDEIVRDRPDHPRLAHWLRCSRYGNGLQRWLDQLPSERIHVVGFGEVRADPRNVADELFAAVGLPPLPAGVEIDEAAANVAGTSRSRRLQRLLTVSPARRMAEELPTWLQRPLRVVARRTMQANLERQPWDPSAPETVAFLRRMLSDDRAVLERLVATHWPRAGAEVAAWPRT